MAFAGFQLPAPFSDDFAVLLGIKQSANPNYPVLDEIEKFTSMCEFIDRLNQESEEQQIIVLSRFAAFYLPATIDRALNPPPLVMAGASPDMIADCVLLNGYILMLSALQDIPYFTHYFRSSSPATAQGKRLPGLIAERLVTFSPRWNEGMHRERTRNDPDYKNELVTILQLLASLCTIYVRDDSIAIPSETKERLLPVLEAWKREYRNEDLGRFAQRLYAILTNPAFRPVVKMVRKGMKNWDMCGLPTCEVKENLKACSKLLTRR
ncbi:hypothetical protein BDZ89DRAFT_1162040 [Hymenopellis radicata]|nr:hypothetical protein BDZ89DRAFT_1162040 [Hymenopellis radicata]